MQNYVTRYMADYLDKHQISLQGVEEKLDISMEKLFPDTEESLTAEEFLKLCQYLHIRPETIPMK